MNQYYENLRVTLKPRLTDFLKADNIPFDPPALSVCPHCHENCSIMEGIVWFCRRCQKDGDIVDYVMANNNFQSEEEAIRYLCRLLRVKNTHLDLYSADDIMDMQFTEPGFIVDKLLTKGLSILAGPSKSGKSWLALWFAHCVSVGQPVWDFKTSPGTVLYMCLEDSLERVQRRLVDVTGGETGNILIATEAEMIGNGFEEQIISAVAENPGINFIIIDTLQKIRDMKADKYSYSGDYNTMTTLKKLADRFRISILLIHHTRKEPSQDPFDMVSGTTGLMGCADATFVMLKPNRMQDLATLDCTGRDIEDMHFDLRFDRVERKWEKFDKFFNHKLYEEPPKNHYELHLVQLLVIEKEEWTGTASELTEEIRKLDGNFSTAPNALTRILNANNRVLRETYKVGCETGKKRGNVKYIELHYLRDVEVEYDVYDESDIQGGPRNTVQTVHTVPEGGSVKELPPHGIFS